VFRLKSYLKRKVTGALLLDGTQDKLKTSNHGVRKPVLSNWRKYRLP
jgi:hypothetical protein